MGCRGETTDEYGSGGSGFQLRDSALAADKPLRAREPAHAKLCGTCICIYRAVALRFWRADRSFFIFASLFGARRNCLLRVNFPSFSFFSTRALYVLWSVNVAWRVRYPMLFALLCGGARFCDITCICVTCVCKLASQLVDDNGILRNGACCEVSLHNDYCCSVMSLEITLFYLKWYMYMDVVMQECGVFCPVIYRN